MKKIFTDATTLCMYLDGEEQFLVLAEDKMKSPESLEVAKELLTSATPLKAELDRNLQVFRSSSRVTHFDLPNEFYKLSVDEIKKEQKLRYICRAFIIILWCSNKGYNAVYQIRYLGFKFACF